MPPRAIWTSAAESDLEEIVYYISVKEGRPTVAEQIANGLKAECDRRASSPLASECELRLGPEYRRFTFKRQVVIYRPWEEGIAVLRIVDGSRDFDRVFGLT